ncbi:hypothetical protein MSAN_01110100 [Mycena sanguinolenta]|uniref:Uncharacterized protein n=1 Tax=Mycena sanguinolenta TaxID=230812 RepID=A0A8H6YKN4_9AGAR|nr:hypothetical protein MSAN_01110100 [Mycena sanguinolenta]
MSVSNGSATMSTAGVPAHKANTAGAPRPGLPVQIQHQRNVVAADEEKALMEFIKDAFGILRDGCAACWARGIGGWEYHGRANCPQEICTAANMGWDKWHKSAMKSTTNKCWQCTISRKYHRRLEDVTECENEYILQAAIYGFVAHPADGLHYTDYDATLPKFRDFSQFWEWADKTHSGVTQNMHLFFAWLVEERGLLARK